MEELVERGNASLPSMSLGSAYQGKQMQSAHGTSSSQLWERPTCWHYAITMLHPTSHNPPHSQALGHATQLPNSKKPTVERLKLCEAPERTAVAGYLLISVYIFACILKGDIAEMCQWYSGRQRTVA